MSLAGLASGGRCGITEMKRSGFSWTASKQSPDRFTKAGELVRYAPAQQKAVAVVVQTEAIRKTESPIRWEIPRNCGCEIMRCVMQAGTLRAAQPSVHFHSRKQILAAQIAAVG